MFCVVFIALGQHTPISQAFVGPFWNPWATLDCGLFWVHEVCNYPKLMVAKTLVWFVLRLHKYLSRCVYLCLFSGVCCVSAFSGWIICEFFVNSLWILCAESFVNPCWGSVLWILVQGGCGRGKRSRVKFLWRVCEICLLWTHSLILTWTAKTDLCRLNLHGWTNHVVRGIGVFEMSLSVVTRSPCHQGIQNVY